MKCWKYPSNSTENIQKFCSFIKTTSLKQKQHVFRTFQFWPKSLYPDLTGVAILLVDFFGWVFSNVENTLPILLKHSKCCSFIKTISLKQKQHVLRTFQFWPKSLYPDLTGVAILLVDFFGWVFQMLKIPFEFFWNIQNFVLSSKQSVWGKNSMFCGLFNFDQNRCIRTLPAWPFCWLIFLVEFFKCWKYPSNSSERFKILFFHQKNQFEEKTACFADFSILTKIAVSGPYRGGHFFSWFFWLIFWNVENTLQILLKNSKFCSFIKTISLKQKQHVLRTFQFWTKSLYPDLTAWVGWFFWLSFSNVENTLRILLKHSKFCSFIKTISLKQKQHVLRTFQFWPKSLYPDLTGVAILLVFFGWVFQMLKMPFQFFWNIFLEAKTGCFADFSIDFRRGHFLGWFFEMLKIPFEFFWNIQNFVLSSKQSVWSKNSMFCGLFNFDENRCIRTLPAWQFCWLIFLVEFFKCWKYPSNSSETFKILFFHQNNQFEAKTACFADFSILTKIAVSGPYRVAILLVDFFGWVFQMLKIPFEFFWNIQNFVLSSKQSVWSKNSMFCGLFNFDQNRCIRTLPAWQFCWLIFLVEFFKCWKYPSNSSETFKILFFHQNNQFEAKTACFAELFNFDQNRCIRTLPTLAIFWLIFLVEFFKCWKYPSNSSETFKMLFFHQNNQFEAKTACFADFSILTKIAVSGPYRRGHFVGWFFLLIFWNVENTLLILLKHSKFCSFIKTISLKQKQYVLRTFQFWQNCCIRKHLPEAWISIFAYPVDFFGWVFQMLKIPFEFFWNIQNFVLSSKQSVWSKNSMFCGLFNFDQNRCIRTLPAWPIFLGWFFLVEFFQMLKIPFEFFWNIQNFVLSSKQSVWSKNSMFCGLFNFDQNRCIRTLPAWPFCWLIFLVEFFKCWKYPSNSSETFKILFFHQNNQFEAKTACFADFSILTKIAVSGPYRRGNFVGWFFWLSFSNVENTLSNSSETFKILFFHQNNQFEAKTSMFCGLFNFDQNRCIRTLPAWPFCWLIFWVFQMLKIPFEFFWNIQNFVLSSKQSVWSKNSMFCGLFNFDQNRCIRTLPAWQFCWLNFFGWVFQMLKIPFEFFWNIQNFVLSSKQSVWSKNSMFCGLFNFDQNRCIRTLPAWPFFWLIFFEMLKIPFQFFWNIQNVVLSSKQSVWSKKQHVLRTFQFWPKSLYPDLTDFRGHFFGWFFEMLKIPFQFFWNIQNVVLSSKQSVWSKNSMFCGLFNFDQNRCIRTLPAWQFCWLIFLVEFFKCWKYPSNSSETFKILFFHQKQSVWSKNSMFCGLFNFDQNRCIRTLPAWPFCWLIFFGWVFQMLKIPFEFFWNIQNVVLSSKQSVWSKNSMFCGLFNFDQNRCIRTLPAWQFCWLIFLVEFFKCWKYPSNSSETFKILFFHQNNQFEAKTACFADFSILTKIAVSGPYRRGHFVGWFFWLSFSNVENTLPILLKHSKCCSFIKTISLKQKTACFADFSILTKIAVSGPYRRGHFVFFEMLIFLVDFLKCWKYPSNSSETFKILFFHQNNQFEAKTPCFAEFSILTKIAVSGPYRGGHFFDFLVDFLKCWKYPSNSSETFKMLFFHQNNQFEAKNSMFCGLFNFDQNRCIRTLQAWPFFWLIFLVEFFKCWKYPSNSSETFKILFFHQNNQFEAKNSMFLRTFQFWPKSLYPDLTGVAIFLLVDFFGWVFSNVENTLRILLKHSKFVFFHQNNQFEAKTACFADVSILTKIAVSGPYRRGHFVSWFFW